MSPILIKTLGLLLSLSFLIVLHELGHFIPAKLFKTRVEKFFLFFDVKFALFQKKIGETVYGIGWLPLGGYVKISGMIDESMDREQMAQEPKPWEFRSKPAWQRLIIMVGGVTVNLILGFLIYMMILFVWGQEQLKPDQMPHGFDVANELKQFGFQTGDVVLDVNGQELDNALEINRYLLVRDVSEVRVEHSNGQQETLMLPDSIGDYIFKSGVRAPFVPRRTNVIDTVLIDGQGYKAGLRNGDEIIAVNESKIEYFDQIKEALNLKESNNISFVRDGKTQTISVIPDKDGKLRINSLTYVELNPSKKEFSFGESISKGFSFGYWTLHDYVVQFKYIFTKKGATQVGGFGTIASLFPSVWNWQQFWETTALISIILAFMNILPIPALDGGHVMFLMYEIITGRKPSEKFLEYAQMVGFILLIGLLLFANGNDVYRWLFDK